ncbi:MAG: radical SAM protein [Bacteroidetes bacterium]|nr:radical SAM protein [Bacteroidota bacterium]
MKQNILFITPPFTQPNTPYPATPYLKGFLNTKNIQSNQVDLGIEVILELFSSKGLSNLFNRIEKEKIELSENARCIVNLKKEYINTIDAVISFLQDTNPTFAYLICNRNFLPETSRFSQCQDLEWHFGTVGIRDKGRYLATLYLEDICDLISQTVDPNFGFSRYAEHLGRSASSFDEIDILLNKPNSFIDELLIKILKQKIEYFKPTLVAITIPFPGNLFSALKCGQWIKKHYPETKIILGGGYVNTELRSLQDVRVFDYTDFITLDDGELPILKIIEYLNRECNIYDLKRTFILNENKVTYIDNSKENDITAKDTGTPDYSDLPLNKYISVIEIANPMHRLWSDGRWNKLTLAHGCYWGKCSFCDISLDYIKRYEPNDVALICDRIEKIIEQTKQNGFHFVDEAAPPALLKELALEIIKRNITIVWWTNIRFEKSFTYELCQLLKKSGCIAVSGGLEVASDRILKLINKGITVTQAAKVAYNFSESDIMVHAYLMYGFPTQTAQETIDSLEIVRQFFMLNLIQSAYWHKFTMTAHSAIALNPDKFNVEIEKTEIGTFANNDLIHIDKKGCNHDAFSDGLKKSLFNYMNDLNIDMSLDEWFDFDVPMTIVAPDFIKNVIDFS